MAPPSPSVPSPATCLHRLCPLPHLSFLFPSPKLSLIPSSPEGCTSGSWKYKINLPKAGELPCTPPPWTNLPGLSRPQPSEPTPAFQPGLSLSQRSASAHAMGPAWNTVLTSPRPPVPPSQVAPHPCCPSCSSRSRDLEASGALGLPTLNALSFGAKLDPSPL